MSAGEDLARGATATAEGRWEDARAAFEEALAREESAEALLGLGGAVWWLGGAPESIGLMERAYALQRRADAVPEAIITAVTIAIIANKSLGNLAMSAGWVARARTLLGDDAESPLAGWADVAEAATLTDPARAIEANQRAVSIARAHGDRDLELSALAALGCSMVKAGRLVEGLAAVDEAMAGVRGREFGVPETVVAACCSMLEACDRVADLTRVRRWVGVADDLMGTFGSPFLFADCRHRHGSILLATGYWQEAERELLAALRATSADSAYHRQATARLAELRVRQGRLEDAWALLEPIAGSSDAQPVEVALRRAREEYAVAAAIAERWIAARGDGDGEAARVLEPLVQIRIEQDDLAAAEAAVARLRDLASGSAPRPAAHAALAEGRLAHARGRTDDAVRHLERAMDLFASCSLPYETAAARFALADALREQQPAVAIAEAQGALSTFERLGAARDADIVAALLRALGGPARTGPKDVGVLTKREQEVLALLAEGLSNPEIATRLFISQKTVSHHVGNVLMKLGVRNRTEAAAFAARAGAGPAGVEGSGS